MFRFLLLFFFGGSLSFVCCGGVQRVGDCYLSQQGVSFCVCGGHGRGFVVVVFFNFKDSAC